jgi:SAM-dependent methyltransferase
MSTVLPLISPERDHMRAVIAAAGGAGTRDGWAALWREKLTLWDLAGPTAVLAAEAEAALASGRLARDAAVLVPGCGAAYDVRALSDMGFARVVGADVAEEAVARARAVVGDAPRAELHCGDFFSDGGPLAPARFDFIFDYTFFCALPPAMRAAWGARTAALLAPRGKLLTLAFPVAPDAVAADAGAPGPPFPVSVAEYEKALAPHGFVIIDGPRPHEKSARSAEMVIWWERK